MIAAGSTIGIIGGGQLGRMLAMAAARLGYRTVILEPQADCPAAQVANEQIVAAYDDPDALERLAELSDVITYEFENVPVDAAETLNEATPVFPPPEALKVSQDRVTEKRFLNKAGIPTAQWRIVENEGDPPVLRDRFAPDAISHLRLLLRLRTFAHRAILLRSAWNI